MHRTRESSRQAANEGALDIMGRQFAARAVALRVVDEGSHLSSIVGGIISFVNGSKEVIDDEISYLAA